MTTTPVTILLLLASAAGVTSPVMEGIALKPSAQVSGSQVTLADIATVEPPAAAAQYGPLVVAPAPSPGQTRSVTVGYLRVRLRRQGLDLTGVIFSGPERVLVSRSAEAPPAAVAVPGPAAAGILPAMAIKPGSRLKIILRAGDLTIEAEGESLGPCALGEVAKFRLTQTRSVVSAKLLDLNTAEVIR